MCEMCNFRVLYLIKKFLYFDREVKWNKIYEIIIGKRIELLSVN